MRTTNKDFVQSPVRYVESGKTRKAYQVPTLTKQANLAELTATSDSKSSF